MRQRVRQAAATPWPVACVLLVVLASTAVEGNEEDWRGFRGQERQGVGASSESPEQWSPTRNVRWKTAVHGTGHSSPVVSGQHVYVTTAYESESATGVLRAARWLRLSLGVGALMLWLLLPPAVERWQRAAAGALLAVFAVLAIADDRLLQFARSPSRAWLGAGASAIVGLLLCAYGLPRPVWARRSLGAALAALGLGLLIGRPAGMDESWPLIAALATLVAAAVAGSVFVLRGPVAPLETSRASSRALVGGWRIAVMLAAVLGGVLPTVLVPRAGWVYAIACLDRATGRVLWITEGFRAPAAAVHSANSQATPTAVTDGRSVFAYFGSHGVMAVSSTGTLLWTNANVPFQTIYGVGASPVLAQGTLVLSGFTPGAPYLAALDAQTGRELWRASRPAVHPEFGDSRTPLVRTIDGRATVIVSGREEIAGYDLATGRESWRRAYGANYQMGSMVSSLVAHGDLLYVPLENGIVALGAASLASARDPIVWTSRGGGSALATPVLYEDRIFAVSAVGVASCTDARTGDLLWRARLEGEYRSSPIAAAGKVYFTNDSGKTTVVSAGPKYEVVAENDLGELVAATIAPVEGNLYVRSLSHVYRIGS